MIVKDFSKEKLKMHLKSNRVNVIEIQPGGVVTKKTVEEIKVDENGEFIRDPQKDLVKIAVVEMCIRDRHNRIRLRALQQL